MADCLSRYPVFTASDNPVDLDAHDSHRINSIVRMRTTSLLLDAATEDPDYCKAKAVLSGNADAATMLDCYKKFKDELSLCGTNEGLIL